VMVRAVSVSSLDALTRYGELVAQWNARTNLTAAHAPRDLAGVLFADAFVLADEAFIPRGSRIIDVGAGAGAPSLPLLLLRPDVSATLVEPRRLRVAFLRTAIGTLDLAARATVLEEKIDPDRPQAPTVAHDVALSRATFAPAEWLAIGLRLAPRAIVLAAGADALPDGHRVAERSYTTGDPSVPRAAAAYSAIAGSGA